MRNRFFAVHSSARRDRRPTDVTMVITAVVIVTVFATRVNGPRGGFEDVLVDLIGSLPVFLEPVWAIAHDALLLWALVLIVAALARRRWDLVRDVGAGLVVTFGAVMGIGRIVNDRWPDVSDGLLSSQVRVDFPVLGFALAVMVTSMASAYLSRPYRYLGRWMIGIGAAGTLALGATTPSGVIGTMFLGLGAASLVHIVFGSPGGLPTESDVVAAMRGIGVPAVVHDISRESGVVRVNATAEDGTPLDVKIYGRDAWDGQLIVSLWRFIWYRDGGPTLAVSRLQQVEHEAFLTLLAERRGAAVHPVVAAGADALGDALLAVERLGTPLRQAGLPPDGLPEAMWSSLDALHRSGITHGRIELDRLYVHDGAVLFADLAAGATDTSPDTLLLDRAQLLAVSAVHAGTDTAVAAALAALGTEGLADVTSYLQPAAMPARLRHDLSAAGVDIDDLRSAAVTASGGETRDLIRLRRLTVGRALMAAVLTFAGYRLVSGLLEIGLDTLFDAIREASLPVVIAAFFISLLSRPVNAYGLTALSPIPVPLGRLTMLMFAMNFVNLAMPSTAGRVAVNIRFFQRSGVDPTTAVAIGALDGFTSFLSQLTLVSTILLFGLGTLDFTFDDIMGDSSRSLDNLLLTFGIVVLIGLAVVALVPKLRNLVITALQSAKRFVVELVRSPQRLAKALASNMTAELIYSVVLYTVLIAFQQDVNFADIVFVGIAVSLFAGLMPVPGGIGVTEAGLTAGFMASGVPQATAFAAALTVRMITFYTPPLIGWFALRWLQRRRFL
jgi:uncharacterized membrane protein YbhN (UPF0104 family)